MLPAPVGAQTRTAAADERTVATATADAAEDLYEQGLEARERGDWQQALRLWEAARDSLFFTPASDPRLGVAFLETCVDHDECDRLADASRMYLWGFSGSEIEAYRDEIVAEARRILPLLTEFRAARWGEVDEEPTEELAHRIRQFWIERDPTPDTPVNERLIEHWERIVHARERFVFNHSSPYRTDDRGLIYVRFGPPGTTTGGFLGSNEMEMKIRIPQDALARERLRRLDTNPQYELWKYDSLNPEEFTYFLFGNIDGTGPFQLVEGPRDLIGNAAESFGTVRQTPGGVRALHYLELFYYRDLAVLGGPYAKRFDELASLWDYYTERRNAYGAGWRASPTAATLESFSYRFAEEDRFAPPGEPVVPSLSAYDRASTVGLVMQPVRVLTEDDRPTLVLQVLSSTRVSATPGRARPTFEAPSDDLVHTLILRDENLEEAGRASQRAAAESGGVSVFRLLHPRPMHVTMLARPEGAPPAEADALLLPAQVHADIPEPLDPDPGSLEMSDLAVGTALESGPAAEILPFPLLPADRIWSEDALRVYLELYHLRLGEDGVGRYGLSFKLVPLDERGEPEGDPEWVTLDLQLESESETARRHFDIGLRGFETGLYRLDVEAEDLLTGTSRVRSATVEITG